MLIVVNAFSTVFDRCDFSRIKIQAKIIYQVTAINVLTASNEILVWLPLKHQLMISSLQNSVKGMCEATSVPFMKPDGDESIIFKLTEVILHYLFKKRNCKRCPSPAPSTGPGLLNSVQNDQLNMLKLCRGHLLPASGITVPGPIIRF